MGYSRRGGVAVIVTRKRGRWNDSALPCIAFRKYDGSNLRFAWARGKGWWQFGTRRRLFDAADPEFGCAIELFRAKYAAGVEMVIRDDPHFRGAQEVVCYCEFLGPHSFAGVHDPVHPVLATAGVAHNDPEDVVMFDVNVHKKFVHSDSVNITP
jgi:hypothetical protein